LSRIVAATARISSARANHSVASSEENIGPYSAFRKAYRRHQEGVSFGDEVLAFDYSLRRGVHKTSLTFVLGSNLQQDRTQRSGCDTGRPFAAPFRQHAPIISRQHRACPSSNTLQRVAKMGHATDCPDIRRRHHITAGKLLENYIFYISLMYELFSQPGE
jgi:hypothetical protein